MVTKSGVLHYLVVCHGLSTKQAHVLVMVQAHLIDEAVGQHLNDEETGRVLLKTINHSCNGFCHEPKEKR